MKRMMPSDAASRRSSTACDDGKKWNIVECVGIVVISAEPSGDCPMGDVDRALLGANESWSLAIKTRRIARPMIVRQRGTTPYVFDFFFFFFIYR